ncbi:MAG: O-methyl transferase [Solirubrobacterales bacterium]|nr:O-methyl transferase [Solirubrobacterales bacterium]
MSPTIERDLPPDELADVQAGLLPVRYDHRMQDVFLAQIDRLLRPGIRILDVGAGRAPTIPVGDRPAGCRYVGTDIDAAELAAAPPGAYDLAVTADATRPLPLDETFDLIISWQVLEHVSSMAGSLDSMHRALAPGGVLLAQLTGSRAAFALVARFMPHRIRVAAMSRFLGHADEEKFPTSYDGCTDHRLRLLLAGWSQVQVIPFYRGASYFTFSQPLRRAYLGYENQIARRDVRALATHYLVIAHK